MWNSFKGIFKKIDPILFKGLSANALGQALTIAIQLLSLPIYLSVWTVEQYGVWVIISAIPVYFSLTDTGISSVAMNKMTMLVARNNLDQANVVFQTALVFISVLILITIILVALLAYGANVFFAFDQYLVLIALVAATLINIYSGLIDGLFRSTNRYALGTNLLTLARLIEWVSSLIALVIFRTPVACATGYLLGRLFSFTLLFVITRIYVKDYSWGYSLFSKSEFLDLFSSSKKYVLLPISFALTLQGTTLVVGTLLGPAAVAIFTSYRTISRFITQLIGAIGHSLWPQFTQLYAREEINLLVEKISVWSRRCAVVSIVISAFTLLFASEILWYWTHGRVPLDYLLLGSLLFASMVSAATNIFYILSIATNNFRKLPLLYMSAAFVSLAIVAAGAKISGLVGVAFASIFVEIIFYIFARSNALAVLSEKRVR